MKHNRKYKLLKDLPDGAIVGDIYVDNGYGKYTNQRMDASKSPVIEHNSYFSWQVETSTDFFEEVNTVEKPEFIIGVDPFRGNIEWVDDTKKAVVFKKDKDGDFIIAYHSRPFSQEQFEKDMKQAQDFFKKAPLFCEECREFGNHKNNCSKRNPEPSSKKEEVEDKPLFVTEDGVEKFPNDNCFYVGLDDWKVSCWYCLPDDLTGLSWDFNSCKHFSTEAAAKDYVILNKPCLSLYDVLKVKNSLNDGTNGHDAKSYLNEKLRELAKSKTNNQ